MVYPSYKTHTGTNKSKKAYIFSLKSKPRGLNLIPGLVNFLTKYRNKMQREGPDLNLLKLEFVIIIGAYIEKIDILDRC